MGRIRRVLFPTKFEELSFQAVQDLYPLKAAGLEEVLFLFVVDRDEVGFVPFGGFDRDLAEELHEQARLRFADWAADLAAQGLASRIFVEVGRPAAKILEVAGRENADLIVAGRQRRMPSDSAHVGATTLEVLRRAAVPVLVARAGADEAAPPRENLFARPLYGTDFSDDAERALAFLEGLAGAVKQVAAVAVLSDREFHRHTPEEIEAEEAAYRRELDEVCDALRAAGIGAAGHVRAGSVVRELLGAAEDHGSTCVVLGTKGRGALAEFWVGSTSHRVAELSPLPVLLVPSTEANRS